jgi:Tol biopolymer transport system component
VTSHSLNVRVTSMSWGTAAVVLMATLSCDSTGPEPKQVPASTVPEVPATPKLPELPAASMVPIMRGQIVFLDPWERAIFVADSTGQRFQRLSQSSGATGLAVSADGKNIAFSTPCNSWCSHMYVMTAGGIDPLLLQTGDTLGNPAQPTWSPDGKRIAFVQGRLVAPRLDSRNIYTINADGTGVTQLTHSDNEWNQWPSWSPDGKQIIFARSDDSVSPVNYGIFEMDPDGSNVRRLRSGFRDRWPTWSPDGSLIAFIELNPDNFAMNLFVMNADGSNARVLKSGLQYDDRPAWSPDGKSITFIVRSASRMCENIWDFGEVPCGQSAKRIGLGGLVDTRWELPSASYVVWQR